MSSVDGRDAGAEVRLGLDNLGNQLAAALRKMRCLHSWGKPYHMEARMVQECKHCFIVRLVF